MKTACLTIMCCVILAFTFLACSDNPAPTESTTLGGQGAAASLAKVSGAGAWIIKYQDQLAEGWVVPDQGIVFLIGVDDLAAFVASGGAEGAGMADVRDLFLPNTDPDLRRLIQRAVNKEAKIYVWDYALWSGSFDQLFANVPPVATGTGRLTWSDTDSFAWAVEHNNADVFGWKGNGLATGADGKPHALNFLARIMWNTSGPEGHWNSVFNVVYAGK